MPSNRIGGLLVAATVLAVGCGESTPSTPTTSPSTVNTYVGELNLGGGVTGIVQLRASSSLASIVLPRVSVLSRLLSWIEPVVTAQSSTASGLLVTSNGQFVTLSGSFSGGTFTVSGSGWSVSATVATSNTSITGTVTAPGGATVPVTSPAAPQGTGPAPSNPVGTYVGTFSIVTTGTQINTRVSDNSVVQNCSFSVVINGTLSLRLFNVLANGLVQSELTSSWSEIGTGTVSPTCGPTAANSWGTIAPSPGIIGFEGPASSLVYGRVDRSAGPGGSGTITRPETFVGAVSGTTVVMQISRSFQFVNQLNTTQNGVVNAVMGYPTISVVTTLVKQ